MDTVHDKVPSGEAATAPQGPQQQPPKVEFSASRQFPDWLAEQKLSLAFTTYQAGKLFFVGLQPNARLSIFERTFNRCMGLTLADDRTMVMSSLYQLWRFEDALEPGQTADGYDRLFVPRSAHTTGDLDVHDIAVDAQGRTIFVNTLFSCLATAGEGASFYPIWRPPFISKYAAEDRCHLNGLAMEKGKPRYVTAVAETDVADGWRDHREGGGVVIDVQKNKIVARGLSMPHSPRVHKGELYLLNSGTGEFGKISKKGAFEPIAFCPGYLRGLSFHGNFAVVGLSKPRDNKTFTGLPLDDALAEKKAEPRCGLYVIDLRTGDAVHWLRIDGLVEELYDVVTMPGAARPMALGLKTDEIRRVISVGEPQKL